MLAGKKLCAHLVVGITNPDPALIEEEPADTKRGTPLANPLTYYERYQIIRAALVESGVAMEEFSIVPLPSVGRIDIGIMFPSMPCTSFPCTTTGGAEKKYFESLGLNVYVLWEV